MTNSDISPDTDTLSLALQLLSSFSGLLETANDNSAIQLKFAAFGQLVALLTSSTDECLVRRCKLLMLLATDSTKTAEEFRELFESAEDLHETMLDTLQNTDSLTSSTSELEAITVSAEVIPTLRISFREIFSVKQSAKFWPFDTVLQYGDYQVTGGKFLYFQPTAEHRQLYPTLAANNCALLTSLVIIDNSGKSRLRSLKHFAHDELADIHTKLQKIVGPFYFKF